tara:strand:- start:1262 stop:2107 length:846 start_codon:yes stop_codon:yes gene_type:complete
MNNFDNTLQSVLDYILSKKTKFITSVALISCIVLLITIFIDDFYTSETRLTGAEVESAPSGASSIINSLPAGIGGASTLNDSIYEAKEVIYSRDFFKRLISYEGVLDALINPNSYIDDYGLNKISNKEIVMDETFYSAMSNFASALNFDDVYEYDYFTIEFTHKSPRFAKNILDIIILELNLQKKDKDIDEAKKAVEFLTQKITTVSNAEVRGSISKLIESQLKREMIATMRDEYLVSVIDSPAQPIFKSGPLRFIIFIITIIISIFLLIPIYAYQAFKQK